MKAGNVKSLADGLSELLGSMGADAARLRQINDNNSKYANAVRSIWKDPEANRLILAHTNAFYVRLEKKPMKGIPLGEEYPVCEICTDDPVIRSELETHKELLAFALRTSGLEFEKISTISSRGDMRKRHPFEASRN